MPLYTKNALKKIKKDALIQMFLDLQAQKVNDCMDQVVEKCCNNAIEEVIEDLKAENEKLKEENSYLENWNIDKLNENYVPLEDYEKLKENLKLSEDKVCELTHEIYEHYGIQEEIEKLKKENEALKETLKAYWSGFQLGNADAWYTPDSWRDELEVANQK